MSKITVAEFARRQGVSRALVYHWLQDVPDLHPEKVGGLTLLSDTDCQRLLSRPKKKIGRPRKVLDTASAVS